MSIKKVGGVRREPPTPRMPMKLQVLGILEFVGYFAK